MRDDIPWQLVLVFTPLSLLSLGGGQSVIADINKQVVDLHGWMSQSDFVALFAISRAAPGPGSLLSTLVGWRVDGIIGALAASMAYFVPSSLIAFAVSRIWSRQQGPCLADRSRTRARPAGDWSHSVRRLHGVVVVIRYDFDLAHRCHQHCGLHLAAQAQSIADPAGGGLGRKSRSARSSSSNVCFGENGHAHNVNYGEVHLDHRNRASIADRAE